MLYFIIGFMGSGKTYWAQQWAAQSGIALVDTDKYIEHIEGMHVAEIFKKKGEDYFRDAERKALHNLNGDKDCIVACGGGMPCFNDNMRWMNEHGVTIYLKCSVDYIMKRLVHSSKGRPLLDDKNDIEKREFVEKLLAYRTQYYEQSKIVLDVEKANEHSLSEIIKSLKE